MKVMPCRLCGADRCSKIKSGIRHDDLIDVYRCGVCRSGFLSSFDHRPPSYYQTDHFVQSSPLKGKSIPERIRHFATETQARLRRHEGLAKNKRVLDYGCGPGAFLGGLSQVASHVVGIEPLVAFQEHVKAAGLPCYSDIMGLPDEHLFDAIFAFHVFEHLEDPLQHLISLSKRLAPEGRIVIEVPNMDDALVGIFSCKEYADFIFNRDHLFYFSRESLLWLADNADLCVEGVRYVQRYPLSNHLRWLSAGRPHGDLHLGGIFDSEPLASAYEAALAAIGATDTLLIQLKHKESR